ncbi:TonB-dependent receptor [Ideonella sp. DXS22W]|uniref:TonB-dependent receptor n=1 Tax=Pseudaquabacterium inlustre TaxID=2984192 RepID=A0ABU9CGX0_9BURK
MKLSPSPIAAAALLALLGTAAQAQQAANSASTQEVVVTGIRAALQQSINQKRNADGVVEVITAEDIGKMPDKNVADSLQRLPGVNIATAGGTEGGFGENDRVSLRGAPSFMTLTTLNGHTVSSGDWYVDNIAGGGRSVSYSLFPSEIIGRVRVFKSSQANLIEGGAAGSVDIEMRRPLDFKKGVTGFANVSMVNSTASGKNDPQLSGLVAWKNDEGTVGALVQVFDEKRHLRRMGQEFLWWDKVATWFANDWIKANPEVEGKNISLLTGSTLFEQERHRQGGLIDVQFKASRDLTFDLSGFQSKMSATNINANFMFSPYQALSNNWSGVGGVVPSAYKITGDTISSITLPGTCPVADCSKMGSSVQDIISRPGSYSQSKYFNLDADWRVSDALSVKGKIGSTEGTGHAQDYGYEVWNAYSGASMTLNGLSAPANVSIANSGTFSPRTGADFFGGWASNITAKDKEDYAQADGKLKLNGELFTALHFGVRTARHTRSLEWLNGTLGAGAGTLANAPTSGLTHFPSPPLSNLLTGAWTIGADAVNAWGDKFVTFNSHSYQKEFHIKETVNAGYLMGDFTTDTLQGNVGLRLVQTKIGVTNSSSNDVWTPVNVNNTYNDVLPSANVRYQINRDLIARGAISRTMARPDFGQLGALNLLDIQKTGSGGNPNLKPVRSNNLEAAVEWYFQPKSMVSAGAYWMKMPSYVTFASFSADFYNNAEKKTTTYALSAAANTEAELKGIELAYVQDLGNGFGFNANYTYADGKETGKAAGSACATTGNCDMVGTSRNVYNLGAFYEMGPLSARVVYNYRSTFLNGLDRKSAIYQSGVGTVSASVNYKLSDKLSLAVEGKDLNDPLLKSYASTPDQPRAFYKNGRQYFLGVRGTL